MKSDITLDIHYKTININYIRSCVSLSAAAETADL
jgi:hypothetical protein